MTRLSVSKAKAEFPKIVERAANRGERTVVSRRGKALAAVIPADDLRLLERLAQEEIDRLDIEDARAALKEAEGEGNRFLTPGKKAPRPVTRKSTGESGERSALLGVRPPN